MEEALNVMMLPKDPNDKVPAFLEIRAGTGGDEEKKEGGKSSTPSQPLTVTGPPKPVPTMRSQHSAAAQSKVGSPGVTPAR